MGQEIAYLNLHEKLYRRSYKELHLRGLSLKIIYDKTINYVQLIRTSCTSIGPCSCIGKKNTSS